MSIALTVGYLTLALLLTVSPMGRRRWAVAAVAVLALVFLVPVTCSAGSATWASDPRASPTRCSSLVGLDTTEYGLVWAALGLAAVALLPRVLEDVRKRPPSG